MTVLVSNKKIEIQIKTKNSIFKVEIGNVDKNQGGRSLILFGKTSDGFLEFGHNLINTSDYVIDGGANQGVYTCFMASCIGTKGKVIAIEPLDAPLSILKRNKKINKFNNVLIENVALWKKNSKGNIYYKGKYLGQASLEIPTAKNEYKIKKVNLKKLDSIVESLNLRKVNFIKLDLQGSELNALFGSIKTIKKFRPTLYLECNKNNFKKICNQLKKYNYNPYILKKSGHLEKIKAISNECNIIFLQKQKASHYTAKILNEKFEKTIRFKLQLIKRIIIKYFFLKKNLTNKKHNKSLIKNILLNSKSQLNQDIFALVHSKFKTNGYFIEIGAADGIKYSNTYLLEKMFKWKGVICEPSSFHTNDLKINRSCLIENSIIYNKNSRVNFLETAYPMLSTMRKFMISDHHKNLRNRYIKYNSIKKTISVNSFLKKHKVPKKIDYLSVDTEGSEYIILKDFNFKKYNIKLITVEHNYTKNRNKIKKLLLKNNYKIISNFYSGHDDWYIKKS